MLVTQLVKKFSGLVWSLKVHYSIQKSPHFTYSVPTDAIQYLLTGCSRLETEFLLRIQQNLNLGPATEYAERGFSLPSLSLPDKL
jgi:hypothetical protein